MGKTMSRINKHWYRFNAENRAQKILEQTKPKPAPKHPSSLKGIQEMLTDENYVDKYKTKDPVLDKHLKDVFVVSHDPDVRERKLKPSEKAMLPYDRSLRQETEFGYEEPVTIPNGKITLKQFMSLLVDNKEKPDIYDVSKISKQYKLSIENTTNILKYFGVFSLHSKEATPNLSSQDKLMRFFEPKRYHKVLSDK